MSTTTHTLARINNTDVQVVENESGRFIPVKPICQLLGIDYEAQRVRFESDEILNQLPFLQRAVAADGKEREMLCIPYKYIFGWLFKIDTSRINETARPAVIAYQRECYDVLFEYYNSRVQFLEEKQKIVDAKLLIVDSLREDFKNAEKNLKTARAEFEEARKMNYDDWWQEKRQLSIEFAPEQEGGEV